MWKMLIRLFSHFQPQKWWYEGDYAPDSQGEVEDCQIEKLGLTGKTCLRLQGCLPRDGPCPLSDPSAGWSGTAYQIPRPDWLKSVSEPISSCEACCNDAEGTLQMLRSQSPFNQSINRPIKHKSIYDQPTLPKVIMSPGAPNGEPVVGSDGSRKKGKATPDTLV